VKSIYEYQGRTHLVWNRKKYCPNCANHEIMMMKQITPMTNKPYFVECCACGYSTEEAETRAKAMRNWMAEDGWIQNL